MTLAQIYFDAVVFAVLMVVWVSLYVGLGHARTRLPNDKPRRRLWCVVLAGCLAGCTSHPVVEARRINHECSLVRYGNGHIALLGPDGHQHMSGNEGDWRVMIKAANELLEDGMHSVLVEKP